MKFTEIKESTIKDAYLEALINMDSGKASLVLKYTCPKCAGYGCNTHVHNNDECSGGTIYKKIVPKNLSQSFNLEQQNLILQAIKKLFDNIFYDESGKPINL